MHIFNQRKNNSSREIFFNWPWHKENLYRQGGKNIVIYYLQRECNLETTISSSSIIKFDTPIALSETSALTPSEDFEYQTNGSIDIKRPGTYAVFWYAVSMVSNSKIGQSYQLKKLDYEPSTPEWNVVAGTSNHIKVAQTPGFAIVVISEAEIEEYGKATIALFNAADASIELTFLAPRAGILIYGFDLDSVEKKITDISDQITDISDQVQTIEEFIHLSEVTEIWSPTPELSGLGAAVISSGFTYNFWGIGTLNHQQTLNDGQIYYLINSSQYTPLTFYQGDSTIGTLWIEAPPPVASMFSFPLHFDATGIYFTPDTTYANLPVGTSFRFTQALILVESSTP